MCIIFKEREKAIATYITDGPLSGGRTVRVQVIEASRACPNERLVWTSLLGLPNGSVLRFHERGGPERWRGAASARPRRIARPASGCGMEPSWVHADSGEYDTAFSCPEHILVEYLSAYILCCGIRKGICLQPDVYYDMMGTAMELQAAPLSI